MIGSDPATDAGGVSTVDPAGGLSPHQVRSWQYYTHSGGWQSDSLLTVTGNDVTCISAIFRKLKQL